MKPNSSDYFRLASAARQGHVVKVRCNCCHVTRFYQPNDLLTVMGNDPIVFLRDRMKCERGHGREYVEVTSYVPDAAEAIKIKYRKLIAIHYVRKVIWRDDV